MTTSGFMTPSDEMPSDDLAMPYAEPRLVRHMASAMPNEPKNGEYTGHRLVMVLLPRRSRSSESEYILTSALCAVTQKREQKKSFKHSHKCIETPNQRNQVFPASTVARLEKKAIDTQ